MKTSLNRFKRALLGMSMVMLIIGCEKPEDEDKKDDDNVMVESRTFSNTSWAYTTPSYYLDLSVPELTADNINSAAVMVYFSILEGTWRAVPYTQYGSGSNYFMNFMTSNGSVKVTWTHNLTGSKGVDPNEYYGTNVKFKVVVIPSTVSAAKQNIDYNNYEEVSKAFDIKDIK